MSGSVSDLSGSHVGYAVHYLDDECCPAVVGKLTFLFTLGFIAAGTAYILTLLLAPLLLGGGRRRRRRRRSLGPLDAWVQLIGMEDISSVEILFPFGGED